MPPKTQTARGLNMKEGRGGDCLGEAWTMSLILLLIFFFYSDSCQDQWPRYWRQAKRSPLYQQQHQRLRDTALHKHARFSNCQTALRSTNHSLRWERGEVWPRWGRHGLSHGCRELSDKQVLDFFTVWLRNVGSKSWFWLFNRADWSWIENARNEVNSEIYLWES